MDREKMYAYFEEQSNMLWKKQQKYVESINTIDHKNDEKFLMSCFSFAMQEGFVDCYRNVDDRKYQSVASIDRFFETKYKDFFEKSLKKYVESGGETWTLET